MQTAELLVYYNANFKFGGVIMFQKCMLSCVLLGVALWCFCGLAEDHNLWNASLKNWPGFFLGNSRGELSVFSGIVAVEPPWKPSRFYTKNAKLAERSERKGNKIETHLFSKDKSSEIYLVDYSLTADRNSWVLNVDLRQNGTAPTNVEYTVMVIPEESLFPGGDYKWVDADHKEHFGRLSDTPITAIRSFVSLELPTIFGTLSLDVNSGLPLTLGDRRINTYQGRKSFWNGILRSPISRETPFRHNARVTLKPYPENHGAKQLFQSDSHVSHATVSHTETLSRALKTSQINLPVPKHVHLIPSENFMPPSIMSIHFDPSVSSARLRKAAGRIIGELGFTTTPGRENALIRCKHNRNLQGYDAYKLTVSKQGIMLEAATERGIFYALQTLAQNFTGTYFPGCQITDSADFAIRGIHMIPDYNSLQFHGKLIKNVLAHVKINHIILESEYVKWDATKGFHHPLGMEKKDLRKLLEIAYDNYIDVTPLIQSFGHCQWLFYGGKNLDMAENPSRPVDYYTSNPRTYKVMRSILDEVLATFQTKSLHIGHDEIELFRFGHVFRKETKARSKEKILLDDLLWYCKYASDHKIQLMLWHDMIMNHSECDGLNNSAGIPAVRKHLPRNLVVTYWEYSPQTKDYPAVDLLKKEGFEVYPVAWYHPDNIRNFATYCKSRNIPAFFGSTWAGYFGTDKVLDEEYAQISAYLCVAAWSWNTAPASQSHDYDRQLFDLLFPPKKENAICGGSMVDLAPFAVLPLKREENPLGFGHLFGLEQLPAEPFFCGNMKFNPLRRSGIPAALTLCSSRVSNAPKSIRIPLNIKAGELYFLHMNLNEIQKDTQLVVYTVIYRDGSQVRIPIRYRREINSPKGVFNIRFNHTNSYPLSWNGGKGKISYFKWRNPHPEKEVAALTLSEGNFAHPVLLLGVSFR